MSEFVVSSGDTTKLLDTAEETFNEVTGFVAVRVERPLNHTVAPRRDDGFNVGVV